MEDLYDFRSTSAYNTSPETYLISPPENLADHYWQFCGSTDYHHLLSVAASVVTDEASIETNPNLQIVLQKRQIDAGDRYDDDASIDTIKAKITSHPSYSKLLDAYIDCQKLGAPQEVAYLLDDIRHENERNATESACLGVEPELDEFMETFWQLLVKYKSDLTSSFDEAMVFLGNVESQLRDLADEGGIPSEEEEVISREETTENTQELKDTLLRKYGGRGIRFLKQEFTKKKKKGKHSKEATKALLEWWNSHSTWPYPTEGNKKSLAETTGLDPKQINNWFINQRKRHWNPPESMRLAINMGGLPDRSICEH